MSKCGCIASNATIEIIQGGSMGIIIDGVSYDIESIETTTMSGVSGVKLTYDDGSLDGGMLFFADGVGLNTVKQAVEAQIKTYTLSISGNVITLTDSDGGTSTATLPVYNGGVS